MKPTMSSRELIISFWNIDDICASVVLVEVPRRTAMALLGQPAAARRATSCSAFDKICQLDVPVVAGWSVVDGFFDNVPPARRCSSARVENKRGPRFLSSGVGF